MKILNKKFINNLFNFGFIEIIGMLIPIVTMPILTRSLGEGLYGIYLYLLAFVMFGNTVIDFGTRFVSVRFAVEFADDKTYLSKLYQETQSLRLFLASLYVIFIYVFFYITGQEKNLIYINYLILPYCLGYALLPIWFYHAKNDLKLISGIQLIIKLINLLVIFFLLDGKNSFEILLFSYGAPLLFFGCLVTFYTARKYGVKVGVTFSFRNVMMSNLSVFLGILAPNLYNSLPTIALGTIYPPEDFSLLAIALRLSSIIVIFQNVISKSLFPILITERTIKVSYQIKIYSFVSVPLILFVSLCGEDALSIFLGANYSGVSDYLLVLMLGVLFLGWTNALSQGFFLVNSLDSIYRNVSIRTSIVSCFLSSLLIYSYGILGGALSVTLARFILFIDYYIVYKKYSSITFK
ncbi:lipopolysaccharide biosynthesis protein [Vibrio tetraodonis]|uniref:lipopolysaccharide biosynthesis protein n=1 Tax=Vibrio tetraodonis TaxID=2231647 RepID=UPI000E0A3A5F|nr:oligosaccharide flippase family protein [Vibrio tetraodonis]